MKKEIMEFNGKNKSICNFSARKKALFKSLKQMKSWSKSSEKIAHKLNFTAILTIMIALIAMLPVSLNAMSFDAGEMGRMEINGAIKASFGATQYLDFVDDYDKGDDADFDATRELGVKIQWILNKNLKGVASFQIGEGSTGGYFGSTDALVGGEEDGDLIVELDNLYIDYTTDGGINFKVGSQSFGMAEIGYGSNIFYEVPAGVTFKAPFSESAAIQAGWFRMADLMDDSETNTDDQADFMFAKLPFTINNITFTPWAAFALIEEDVIRNAPSHWRYAYFNYPGFLSGSHSAITDPMPIDDVTAYYAGASLGINFNDALSLKTSLTYGSMEWETATVDTTIAGFFADVVIDYKMGIFTPELFALYSNGPDANDEDLDMMPILIGGPTYTSSYFGGSRFNDNMFDSYDTTCAASMWAAGFKLKDIKTGERLTHEFQVMYAQGTADENLFQAPDDILLNEDESLVEINFNSDFQVMKNLVFATELGYISFDEDEDYNEAIGGTVEDFWKVAAALELMF
ncbi:conserved exported hypothetical protein [Desulfamplus magnetovallimortis]|uniref:Uncharacterized protein n=1 Tax=Desulfamplus magnetovallimortis TaxID=1246637 RepID=A0A1W1HG09_9BACT|nr:outer membrane homotrimeric porin [Desulfamplus magnetovallimortis]SLM31414.1 conserved exported hypothetical protein [Desulfamplus magnetovallimortis]